MTPVCHPEDLVIMVLASTCVACRAFFGDDFTTWFPCQRTMTFEAAARHLPCNVHLNLLDVRTMLLEGDSIAHKTELVHFLELFIIKILGLIGS